MNPLQNSAAIVTGHSRGLGAAIAAALLEKGVAVLGIARQGNPELSASYPALLQETQIDFADSAHLLTWLGTGTLPRFVAGKPRVMLINNAGIVAPIAPCGQQPAAAIAQTVAVNVTAPLLLANAFIAATADCPDRRLLHVSSGAARSAYPGWNVYCATKAALDLHAQAVALEQEGNGSNPVKIASLAPGVIDTGMQEQIRATTQEDFPLRPRFEALKREGALASPAASAAKLVAYLLSPAFGATVLTDLRQLAP